MDAVDLQPDNLSPVVRNSIPEDFFDQVDPVVPERGQNQEFIPDDTPSEGDELSALFHRQLPADESIFRSPLSATRDPDARIHLPTSIWGREYPNRIDEERDDAPESDSDLNLKRLAKLYEAILNANRD